MSVRGPKPWPCASCPYRKDVPSGVWSEEEYAKLPLFDGPTHEQPPLIFTCHQDDGHLCSGWCGTHDMDQSMGLRIASLAGTLDRESYEAAVDYSPPVELFESGAAAAAHGMAEVEAPGPDAGRTIHKLRARRTRRGEPSDGSV